MLLCAMQAEVGLSLPALLAETRATVSATAEAIRSVTGWLPAAGVLQTVAARVLAVFHTVLTPMAACALFLPHVT